MLQHQSAHSLSSVLAVLGSPVFILLTHEEEPCTFLPSQHKGTTSYVQEQAGGHFPFVHWLISKGQALSSVQEDGPYLVTPPQQYSTLSSVHGRIVGHFPCVHWPIPWQDAWHTLRNSQPLQQTVVEDCGALQLHLGKSSSSSSGNVFQPFMYMQHSKNTSNSAQVLNMLNIWIEQQQQKLLRIYYPTNPLILQNDKSR
eukprot:TRINITY_DN1446_c0_g2_i2.p2 TRINITY_DN1446_c0_g2~~TRINITY_DN1446_c0_g2_i2.p2  ORF type:complete len:199 (-),score=1.57 TRINITY_DN1446_c0_g2_i2:392-988(-)